MGEVKSMLATDMMVMNKLTKIWRNKSVSTATKLRLMNALVWPVVTYRCEAWTLKKNIELYIQDFENQSIRNLLQSRHDL